MTPLLLALMLQVGQPMALHTDLGVCDGTVIAPGQAVLTDGSCLLDSGVVYVDDPRDPREEDAFGPLTGAYQLPSGRVVVRFTEWSE